MIAQLLGAASGLASTWLEGRQEASKSKSAIARAKAEAEAKVMVSAATSTAKWERVMAQNSSDSWKDEAWTVLFILIIGANFVPFLQPYIEQGFIALDKCPAWFQWAMYASIGASFGIRGLKGFKK